MWYAFKNDAVGCKKESSLCWQDVWAPQETPSSFLPAIRVQKHPQPFWHQVLSRKKCWSENLGLMGTEHNDVSQKRTKRHVRTHTHRHTKEKRQHICIHTTYEPIRQGVTLNMKTSVTESDFFKAPGNQVNVILSNCNSTGLRSGRFASHAHQSVIKNTHLCKHIKNLMAL